MRTPKHPPEVQRTTIDEWPNCFTCLAGFGRTPYMTLTRTDPRAREQQVTHAHVGDCFRAMLRVFLAEIDAPRESTQAAMEAES